MSLEDHVLEKVADVLADMQEEEVDQLLSTSGGRPTPDRWGLGSRLMRRMVVLNLLRDTPDRAVINLYRGLVGSTPATAGTGQEAVSPTPARPPHPTAVASDGPIFLVHGHDHRVLHYAARVVQQCTGRDVIILHEQANGGRTLLEKFEDEAAGAAYAVVLLTGDDEGGLAGTATHKPRARQNVVFELGFFFGKLGRKRVAVLLDKGVDKPSDLDGLVYLSLEDESWRYDLLKELQKAGILVDYERMP